MIRYHVSLQSKNKKLGPIATTTASRDHCPSTCPLKKAGCYASSGPMAIHWAKVTDGKRGTDARQHAKDLAAIPSGVMVRLHQAGDFATTAHVTAFAAALKGRAAAAWTYTHHRTKAFIDAFRMSNDVGLTVNLSANSLSEADTLMGSGSPVVAIVSRDAEATGVTPGGARYVVCPEQQGKVSSCADCGAGRPLCARADRPYVIAFRAHGTQVRAAERIALA